MIWERKTTMGKAVGLIKSSPCGLCGDTCYRPVFQVLEYRIIECQSCGLARTFGHSKPINQLYAYEGGRYEGDILKSNNYWTNRAFFVPIFERILDSVERYTKPGRLLDVGCNIGLLLDVARCRGWETKGVEISAYASSFARQRLALDVYHGELIKATLPLQYFDVVVMNHVLEHLESPLVELSEIHRILRSEGLLVLGVPNFGSWFSRILREKWIALCPEVHVWHFTLRNLTDLLLKAGFSVVHVSYDNQPFTRSGPKALVKRAIGWLALKLRAGEAMLLLCRKLSEVHQSEQGIWRREEY